MNLAQAGRPHTAAGAPTVETAARVVASAGTVSAEGDMRVTVEAAATARVPPPTPPRPVVKARPGQRVRFLTADRDKPFFAYLSFNAPHSPHQVPDADAAPYRRLVPAKIPADTANVYGMIANMDYEERSGLPCIGTERADLVVAGCAILEAIMEIWPAENLGVADRGIREGILRALMARDGWVL